MKTEHLFTDQDIAHFIVNGYHVLKLSPEDPVHEVIAQELDQLDSNPGDAIIEKVPDLKKIVDHPVLLGALVSLLGKDFNRSSHAHWHCRTPGVSYQHWHQDGTNQRHHQIKTLICMYYPRTVKGDMGPTVIVPGTHFRNQPTTWMTNYYNIKGQVPLTLEGGSFVIGHYDLWHGALANTSDVKRHMVKLLFNRRSANEIPSWDHEAGSGKESLDWNPSEKRTSVPDILTFSNPLRVGQSELYKERAIRNSCWKWLCGKK